MRRIKVLAGAVAAVSVIAAGCGSSSHSASTGSGRPTYTIGLLTDLTGPAASGSLTAEKGLQAGIWRAQREGYNLKYVVADTGSSPTGALTAARKLVEENHVLAVVAISPLTVLAASFFASHAVPVIGSNEDGTEWLTARNMFATTGGANTATEITTEWGQYMKMQGVTNMASVGYTLTSSSNAATNWADSVKSEGIKIGYLNTKFPLGSTNVGPAVLQMKQDGVNGLVAALAPNTGLAIVTSLRQDGVTMKAVLLSGGYGGDLSQGGPDAAQQAQGVSFYLPFEPVELHTAGTEAFVQALRAVGVQGDPSFAEYNAYLSVDILVQGLKSAGAHPTQAGLISALNGIHDYTGAGLFGGHTLDLGTRPNSESGVDHCEWYTKLEGTSYALVPGAEPLCGTVLPGMTLSQG
jgi:ABC-type branched-subunit amino acid transport system substrate-binding protein